MASIIARETINNAVSGRIVFHVDAGTGDVDFVKVSGKMAPKRLPPQPERGSRVRMARVAGQLTLPDEGPGARH